MSTVRLVDVTVQLSFLVALSRQTSAVPVPVLSVGGTSLAAFRSALNFMLSDRDGTASSVPWAT